MEAGSAFDDIRLAGERRASLADDGVEFVDRFDVLVDDGLRDQTSNANSDESSPDASEAASRGG